MTESHLSPIVTRGFGRWLPSGFGAPAVAFRFRRIAAPLSGAFVGKIAALAATRIRSRGGCASAFSGRLVTIGGVALAERIDIGDHRRNQHFAARAVEFL